MKYISKLIRRASHRALGQLADNATYDFLRQHPFFRDLGAESFLFVMERVAERRYRQDEVIFRQGQPGICLFVVRKGSVEVFGDVGEGDDACFCATVPEGSLFGEMSVISLTARTMSARAREHGTVLLALSTFDLEALADQHPKDAIKILRGLTDTICQNLVKTTQSLSAARDEVHRLKKELADREQ